MIWHLLPVKDTEEHLEESTCKCEPKIEVQDNGDLLVIHNSFDRRELIEEALEIINKE